MINKSSKTAVLVSFHKGGVNCDSNSKTDNVLKNIRCLLYHWYIAQYTVLTTDLQHFINGNQ